MIDDRPPFFYTGLPKCLIRHCRQRLQAVLSTCYYSGMRSSLARSTSTEICQMSSQNFVQYLTKKIMFCITYVSRFLPVEETRSDNRVYLCQYLDLNEHSNANILSPACSVYLEIMFDSCHCCQYISPFQMRRIFSVFNSPASLFDVANASDSVVLSKRYLYYLSLDRSVSQGHLDRLHVACYPKDTCGQVVCVVSKRRC